MNDTEMPLDAPRNEERQGETLQESARKAQHCSVARSDADERRRRRRPRNANPRNLFPLSPILLMILTRGIEMSRLESN